MLVLIQNRNSRDLFCVPRVLRKNVISTIHENCHCIPVFAMGGFVMYEKKKNLASHWYPQQNIC